MPFLYVVGAEPSIKDSFGSGKIHFDVRFLEGLPQDMDSPAVILLPFPQGRALFHRLPKSMPLLAYGAAENIQDAFEEGARDYIRSPFDISELDARAKRLLGEFETLPIPGTAIRLRGSLLIGDGTKVFLGREETMLLRTLISAMPGKVSRVALQRYIWPDLRESSRVVDITVSRLRRRLREAGGLDTGVQIRSVRRFGYSLTIYHYG